LDVYGEKSIEFAKSEVFTSKILLHQGEPVDAAELLNDAIAILENTVGEQHQLAVEARGVLADALTEAIAKHNRPHASPDNASPSKAVPKKSSPKKVNAPFTRLTEAKKSPSGAAVAEERVQKRIAEEVALKMAAEKKKMQAQMEKKMAQQVAEQMAVMQAMIQVQMKEQLELQLKIQAKMQSPVPNESIISALDSLAEASVETAKALGSPASTLGSVASPAPSPVKESSNKKGARMASPTPSELPSPPADSPPRSSPSTSMLENTTLSPTNPYAPVVASALAPEGSIEVKKSPTPDKSAEIVTKLDDDNYVLDMSAYEMRASPVHASASASPTKVLYADTHVQSPLSPQVLMQSPNASFSNKTPQSVRIQSPPGGGASPGKKSVRMRSPPPLAVRPGSGSSDASTESPAVFSKPRVRMHSPPPQHRPAFTDDEEDVNIDVENEVPVAAECTDSHLMKLALGDGSDVGDDDYAYDDGEFEESAEASDALGVDENAGPNTPPKSRPSSVNRKLQTAVQNARGMELTDSGTKSPSSEERASFKHSDYEKGIAMLTAAQQGEFYGPSGSAEALDKMKLLTVGAGGANKRSALRSRERKPEPAEGQSGMVMLSKGSSFIKNKVVSIDAARLHEDDVDDINKGVKHRIKKKY